jgi:hypothetical protein
MISFLLNRSNFGILDTVFSIFRRLKLGARDKIVAHQDLGWNRIAHRKCKLYSYLKCEGEREDESLSSLY